MFTQRAVCQRRNVVRREAMMQGFVMTPFIETHIRLASMRQIHAAMEHLHWGDFECAITPAAAGEGMLPEADAPHFRQKVMALSASMPEIEKGAKKPNDFINWLKHGKTEMNGPGIENATITALEVIVVIYRAVTKFQAMYDFESPQMLSFKNWVIAHLQNEQSAN
jgi:hypothetical protein